MNNPYSRDCPSIYRGVVEDNIDPKNLGRCKVRVPSIHGELTYPVDILPWARPIALSPINSNRGSANIPDIGDIVWVLFEGGVKEFPLYLGGTYATGDVRIDNNIVDFYIEEDSKVSYHREKREYTIQIGENKFTMSPEGIRLTGNVVIENNLTVLGSIDRGGEDS